MAYPRTDPPSGSTKVLSAALLALAVAVGGVLLSPLDAAPPGEFPAIEWNDNEEPAGVLEDGTLRVTLEVRRGEWSVLGEEAPTVRVLAFAEAGEAPRIPGPMIRVPAGTRVVATLRNPMDQPLEVRGLGDRSGLASLAPSDPRDPVLRLPAVTVPAGGEREVRFVARDPGTYTYLGRLTEGSSTAVEPYEQDLLAGALIVDPPTGGSELNEKVMVIQIFLADSTVAGRPDFGQEFLVINGRPWPHTERLHYEVGDRVTYRVINASFAPHPMHLHGFFFRVDARGDLARDTVYWPEQRRHAVTERMDPWTTMTIRWSPDRPGGWVFHCHLSFHVLSNPAVVGDDLPGALERIVGFFRTDSPPDPHHHAEHGMGGLVMGIEVRAPEGWQLPEPEGPRIRLHVREDSVPDHALPRFGFALGGSDGSPPPEGEVPFPGPTLVLHSGAPAAVRVVNETDEPTTTHWHGLEVESLYDGVAGGTGYPGRRTPAILPGESFDVELRTDRPGTYIYHTHLSDLRQQGAGLYGPLVILPEGEAWEPDTDLIFMVGAGLGEGEELRPGRYLNGSTAPDTVEMTAGTTYRLRLINITLGGPGLTFRLVRDGFPVEWRPRAHDGWDLPPYQRRPVRAQKVVSVGETYDFEYTPGSAGELALELRRRRGELLVTQPIRVVTTEEETAPLRAQSAPPVLDDGWRTASPDAVGLDGARLAEMTEALRRGEHGNVHALLIERDGRLVYEEYFTGEDESLGQDLGRVTFGRTSLHDIRSVGKSIVSTLVGIAIEEGALPSVDEPLHALLPDYAHLLTGGKREVRLRHLLGMSAGLDYDELSLPYSDSDNDWVRLVGSPDPLAFVLGLDLVAEPGSTFAYNTGLTQLLAAVLERATGEEIEDYADRVLFRPLGIYDVVWRGDLGGIPNAGAGMRMRPRDVVKLGSLYLHGGRWNGEWVVPEAWVEEATRRRLPVPYPEPAPAFVRDVGYGYQWWTARYGTSRGDLDIPFMLGNGQQRVMLLPELGVAVTLLAGYYGENTWMPDRLLVEHVLEALDAPTAEAQASEDP